LELALDTPARLRAVPKAASSAEPSVDATDADLLVRVAERDRIAFEALYHRYVRSVYGIALRRLRDRQRAEDAVQETFTAVWRSAASYRPERGPAAPWLYAVARNAIVDRLRARNEPPMEAPDLASGEAGPAEHAEASFVAWRVHRALEELPAKERRSSSSPIGAACRRARSPTTSTFPRHGQDAHPQRAVPPSRSSRRRACVSPDPDFDELIADAEPGSASASAASTTCSSSRARRPS